jgi:hypothetical protein
MALPPGFVLEQPAPPPAEQPANMGLPPGFELESSGGGIPKQRRSFSDVPSEALANLPSSAANFYQGLLTAITNPVQTVSGTLDVGAGALQNLLPKDLVDLVNQIDNKPEAAKRAVDAANAVGGMYKERYGSIDALKNTLATDPVGAASDLSSLLSGSGAALKSYARVTAPVAAKILNAPSTAATSAISNFDRFAAPFETAALYTNPTAPVTKALGYGLALGGKAIGNIMDAFSGGTAAVRAGNIVRNALTEDGRAPQNVSAAQNALNNAPANMTVRQALADVTSPQVQFLGQTVESKTAPGRALDIKKSQEADRMARLQAATPDINAAEAIRANTAKLLYGISDEALLPGRERQFKTVQTGTVKSNVPMIDPITGQPKMAPVSGSSASKSASETQLRPTQVEIGRDSFNQPIYETRMMPASVPTSKGSQTSDFLTNTPKMVQEASIGGQPLYKQILAGYKYDPQLAKLMERPAIQAAFDSAAVIAANKGIPLFNSEGKLTGNGAHLVKLAIDDAINPTPGTPIARNISSSLISAKDQYVNWVEKEVPAYKVARQTFAAQSEPVNQAKVLGAMQDVLKQPLETGERAGAFATVLGRGEKALLKKSTGEARFADLGQVLSPQQMNVVKGVESELKRDAEVVRQTQAGADAMKIILDANQSKFRLPSFLDVKVTVTNQMLDILKDKMSANVLKELEKGFQSAENFQTLMKKVPASQRLDVLRALGQANLSPTKLNVITQTQNALAPTQKNQNAMRLEMDNIPPQLRFPTDLE